MKRTKGEIGALAPMASEAVVAPAAERRFFFFKGGEDVLAVKDGQEFNWEQAARKVRENLGDAMNARHVAFLFGSGCSSLQKNGKELGIPTMKPLASTFTKTEGNDGELYYATKAERTTLQTQLGLDITDDEYSNNLERLLEVLHSCQFILKRTSNKALKEAETAVNGLISKVTRYILRSCTVGAFTSGDAIVSNLYQTFYRKLVYRDRALPRPCVFTLNYDLFNETAMDRLGIPYCNGFSGTVERRFNPATFRYSLAEQLDITSKKWTAVDNFVYLYKLHGSINWIEEGGGLFPIREMQQVRPDEAARVMIYPTPAKQNASLGSPYSDLFREFQNRIVREQSVLFVLGYSFADEHVNNIIFQALTIPTFRMIAFLPSDTGEVASKLRDLADSRIWMIGGDGRTQGRKAHYFDTFVEEFMPERPGDKVDTAIAKVLQTLMIRPKDADEEAKGNDD